MYAQIALQLYSVRNELAKDYAGIIKQVAGMGYRWVEMAGTPEGMTAAQCLRILKDNGITPVSIHGPVPVGEGKAPALEAVAAYGCKHLVTGKGPDDYKTLDLIRQTCEHFNAGAAVAVANGLTFSIHNHWWEFQEVEGRRVYEVMLEHLSRSVHFELDVYWAQTGGCDPVAVVRQLGARAPLLHMKDGPCQAGQPMTALGEGKVDIPGVVQAARNTAEYLIVELDECATDMLEAVAKSYQCLAKQLNR